MLFNSRVKVSVKTRFSVWLVSGFAHVVILLSVVIVTLPTWVLETDDDDDLSRSLHYDDVAHEFKENRHYYIDIFHLVIHCSQSKFRLL